MRFNVCDTLTLLWSCLLGHQLLWWKRLAGLSKVIWWAFGGRLMGHFNGFGRRLVGNFRGLAGHFRWVWRDISDGFGGTFQIDLVGGFGGNVDGAFYMDFVSARELFSWK